MLCTGYKISYIIISTFNEYTFCTTDIHNWPHLSHTFSDTQLHTTCYLTQVHLVLRSCSTRRLWLALHGFTKLFMLTRSRPFLASWCPATRYSSPRGRQIDIRPFKRTLSFHYMINNHITIFNVLTCMYSYTHLGTVQGRYSLEWSRTLDTEWQFLAWAWGWSCSTAPSEL